MSATCASTMVGSMSGLTVASTPIQVMQFSADFGFSPIKSSIGVLLPRLDTGIRLLTASCIAGIGAGYSVHRPPRAFKIAASLSSTTLFNRSTPPFYHCV